MSNGLIVLTAICTAVSDSLGPIVEPVVTDTDFMRSALILSTPALYSADNF